MHNRWLAIGCIFTAALCVSILCLVASAEANTDPLPSRTDGAAKSAMVDRVPDEAKAQGRVIVSMKNDWKTIFKFEP